jgi:hypothetical protein
MIKKLILIFLMCALLVSTVSAYRSVGTNYHNKTVMIQMWKDLCNAHSSTCSYEVIGKSYLGQSIYLFKVGTTTGGRIMIDGSLHGWEDSGTEFSYVFAKYILEGSDSEAKRIQKNNYMLFIPIVNMDSTDRQNARSVLDDGTEVPYGVDLNRNFCTNFGGSGSGDPTNSFEYRGPYCASEDETQAVRAAMQKYKPKIYLNVHMGGGKTYGTCNANSVIGKKILAEYDTIRLAKGVSYRYTIGGACGAGMSPSDAYAFGADAWYTETVESAYIPNTAADLINEYWPKNYPMWVAMAHAVEVVANSTANTTVTPSCSDSDGGNKTLVRGTVSGRFSTGSTFTYTDSCVTSGNVSKVKEYTSYKFGNYTCQKGCLNGACISNTSNTSNTTAVTPSCSDSDGNNTFSRGYVYGKFSTGSSYNYSDNCFMSGNVSKVTEYYCSGSSYRKGNYTCAYGCTNGACVAAPTPPPVDTSTSSSKPKSSRSGGSSSGSSSSKESEIFLYCGDEICTAGSESCSSCDTDCGICPEEIVAPITEVIENPNIIESPSYTTTVNNLQGNQHGAAGVVADDLVKGTTEITGFFANEVAQARMVTRNAYLPIFFLLFLSVIIFMVVKHSPFF